MDRIIIENLEVFAKHGVFPEENILGQKFLFSLTLWTKNRRAGITDELENSVNYGEVCHLIQEYATAHTFRLLEALAENLVEELLRKYSSVSQIDLTIRKPWAPVGLPLESVGVSISRKRHLAYIALGSNMGDRKAYLDGAVKALQNRKDCRVLQVSDYLVTEPYGGVEQEDFLNGALSLETFLDPEELLEALHAIEAAADRKREVRWGPRTLDLDILLYDDIILDLPELQIPHREMHLRSFVLDPLCQIAPWKRHPLLGATVEELAEKLQQNT